MEANIDTIIFPSSLSVEKIVQEIERTEIFPKTIFEQAEIICMGNQTFKYSTKVWNYSQ